MTDHIRQQEQLYLKCEDPWGNVDRQHPRYRLYDREFRVICGLVPPDCLSVVDLGCGLGKLVWLLHQAGKSVIGVDTCGAAIERARKYFSDCVFDVGDARMWEPPVPMDMAILSGCYHLLPEADRSPTLRHIRSYLREGGYVLVVYGHHDLLSGRRRNFYPDIGGEVFAGFEPIARLVLQTADPDSGEETAWKLYLGQKRG